MAPTKIFISYRRSSGEDKGNLILSYLQQQKFNDVFFDRHTLTMGEFPSQIEDAITNSTHFILLLTNDALNRCVEPGDWLRREIVGALGDKSRVIIPVEADFKCDVTLPDDISAILAYQRIKWAPEYVPATLEKIKSEILKTGGNCDESYPSVPSRQGTLAMDSVDSSANSTDFRLSDFNLLKIGDILQEIPRMFEKWPMIAKELLGTSKSSFDKQYGRTMDVWVSDTLEEWIHLKGNEATFNKLKTCLRNRKCGAGADSLERRREEIRNSD